LLRRLRRAIGLGGHAGVFDLAVDNHEYMRYRKSWPRSAGRNVCLRRKSCAELLLWR
jgi:hypothetical protein